jgi:type 1 fimbria pilin
LHPKNHLVAILENTLLQLQEHFNMNRPLAPTKVFAAISIIGLLAFLAQSNAQAANDQGNLIINGQISATTCTLDMGDTGSTGAGSKTLNLGSTAAPSATGTAGATFGNAQTVIFKVTDADGTACDSLGTAKWDIGINLDAKQYTTVGSQTLLLSGGTTTSAAQNVGVLIKTSYGSAVTVGGTALDLSKGAVGYGTLLSGNTSAPAVASNESIALTAQFARTSESVAPTAGAFTATIPLNVWYK